MLSKRFGVKSLASTGAVFLSLNLASCGPSSTDVADEEAANSSAASAGATELVDIGVSVSEKSAAALALLAGASAFSITMDGCTSAYSVTVNQTNSGLKAYKFDQNCLARLTTFTFNSIVYTPKAGSGFTTYAVNETAIFEDASNPSDTLLVKVSAQLSNPVAVADTVAYGFSQISAGADNNISESVVGDSHSLAVSGQAAPSFTIKSVSYVGMTAGGAGQFGFALECTENMTGSALASLCKDVALSDIRYKLIEDTYSGVLTQAQAAALFPTGESQISVGEVIAVGDGAVPKGGFNTVTLDGPNAMHTHPSMLLVVQAADLSYLYFNIDVSTLTQL